MIFETIFWIARTQNQVPDRAFQRVQRVIMGSERVSAKVQASEDQVVLLITVIFHVFVLLS